MTILIGILKLLAIPAIMIGTLTLRNAIENRRCMRCDACRLERQNGMACAFVPHACSKDRAFYRSPDGSERREFGRIVEHAEIRPVVNIGKRRATMPAFKRQPRKVVSIGR